MLIFVSSCTQSGEVWLNNGNITLGQNYMTVKVLVLNYLCLSIFLNSAVKNDDKLNVFLFTDYIIARVTCHTQFSSRPVDYYNSCASLGNMNICISSSLGDEWYLGNIIHIRKNTAVGRGGTL